MIRAPSKYGNRKTVVDGITFASAKEAKRYAELKLMERGEYLSHLRIQPRYPLKVLVCTYVADFAYMTAMGERVEDVKGYKTDVYKIKKKLMKAVHGIDVVEV